MAETKGQLQAAARKLAHRKMSGSTRIATYTWISAVRRTTDELQAKIAELEGMDDRAW